MAGPFRWGPEESVKSSAHELYTRSEKLYMSDGNCTLMSGTQEKKVTEAYFAAFEVYFIHFSNI